MRSLHGSAALALVAASFLCPITPSAHAASVEVRIEDRAGQPLEHAVISLHDGVSRRAPAGTRATIDQRARRFDPTVVPIQAGTDVAFPNSDDVRHHVYSFSHPNAFELKLYHGEPSRPVRFDEPGIVVLGCNIHDGMVGYLHVVDTPLFAKSTVAGTARIDGAPEGEHTLQVWHPDLGTRYLRRPIALEGRLTRFVVTLDPAEADGASLAAARPSPARTAPAAEDASLIEELGSLFD